jgi:hypothetical protein
MAIESTDYLAIYQTTSGEIRKATVGALLAGATGDESLWKEDGDAITPKAPGADLKIDGDGSFVNIDASSTISAVQVNSTNINSSGTITANSSVNAGTGDNIITLDGGTGEIGGGANAFIDGGTY